MRKTPSLLSFVLLSCSVVLLSCKGSSEDEDTGAGDTGSDTSSSAGDGDGDGDGDPTTSDCPPGTFDCPCDAEGMCVAGLACGMDGLCSLGGDPGEMTTTTTTTTGGTTTGGGASDPYNPENCEAPSEILQVELLDGSFCATPCVEDSECPDGPPGTESLCTISSDGLEPNFCGLVCTPGEEACPEGGTCEEIPQQPGFGLCTY